MTNSLSHLNWLAVAIHLADTDERPVLVVDEGGRVRLFNSACEHLLGWRRADVVDRPLAELVDLTSRAHITVALDVALHGVHGRCAVKLRGASGALIDADLMLEPVGGDKRDRGIVGVVESPRGQRWVDIVAEASDFGRMASGERCYELIAKRATPCDGCPVLGDVGASATNVLVLDDGHVMIARAHRTSAGRARVEHELFPTSMAPRLAREQLAALAQRHGLSEREREVLHHLVRGLTVEAIGAALGIAPRTAKFHQANVLDKLGVDSRVELMRLLLEPPK